MPLFKKVTREEEFWSWFQKNEDSLFNFEKDQQRVFKNLAAAMKKVNPDLTFEFSQITDNKREFVISADGFRSAFPAVESFFRSAPCLPRWTFVKFRPRRGSGDLIIGDIKVGTNDLEFTIHPDGGKAGLTVFVKGYNEEKVKQFTQIAFIHLDHAIGEYDMETQVGFVNVKPFEEKSQLERHSFNDLPRVFDAFIKQQELTKY
jgi:hypothetical protein